ncbi:MAG: ATP-binding protein [Clostridiales Family XIII bacterium]|jgi:anti-sigma regulatory factor (Ser/Thr protein kinase)|nr:ATP-binding protein [Clostridiales Family XIII bacterium]
MQTASKPHRAKLYLHYEIDGDDFTRAGEASSKLKQSLKQLGLSPAVIRRAAIAMYEGEINMVAHADGGVIDVDIDTAAITIVMRDTGNGIEDIDAAMKEGYSTASDEVRQMGFGAGMGLPNMKKHSDYMKIDTKVGEGTTVTMKISIMSE